VADFDEPRGDAGVLRSGYERLREAVLSGAAGGWRLGHGVLAARGVTAWMSAVGELAPPASGGTAAAGPAPTCSSESRQAPAGRSASLPDADQVVQVLAQMVLPLAA
jgi:hypothetical protein